MSAAAESLRRLVAAPSLAALRGTLARVVPAGRAPFALYALYTAALFLVFLLATFPHELVVRRLLAEATTGPVAIDVRGVRLGWTLAYVVDELRVRARDGDPGVPLLDATAVRAAPSLLGLLRGSPYPLGVRAELYGGSLAATVDLRAAAFALRASLRDVDLGRAAGLRRLLEGRVAGRVGADVELHGDARRPTTTSGELALNATGLALEAGKVRGITVPDLHFPELRFAAAIKNGRIELGELQARGDEVSLSGQGNVLLQQPLAASLVNLELTFTPSAQAPESLRLALNLIPGEAGTGGERRMRLFGSLGQPRAGR